MTWASMPMPSASPKTLTIPSITGFAADGTIREKYNVVTGNANVTVSNGYKENVIGFGWTNAVYLKFTEISARPSP